MLLVEESPCEVHRLGTGLLRAAVRWPPIIAANLLCGLC